MNEEKHIRTLAMLYEARDAMRNLFGDRYEEKLKPYQVIISPLSEERKQSAISVAIEMAEKIAGKGVQPVLCVCAGLELMEKAERKE